MKQSGESSDPLPVQSPARRNPRRGRISILALLMAGVLWLAACAGSDTGQGASSSAPATQATAAQTTGSTAPTASTQNSFPETTNSTSASTGTSNIPADPSILLTDEEAGEYFGEPARHEGPTQMGAFTNVEYFPQSGGRSLVLTVWDIGSLELFEKHVKDEAEALGETPEKIEGLGESAYFNMWLLKFYKHGGLYQLVAMETGSKSPQELKEALLAVAKIIEPRVP